MPASESKSSGVVDPVWMAAKEQGLVRRSGTTVYLASGEVSIESNAPPSHVLPHLDVAGKIIETQGNQYDDLHHSFVDANYWNFCMAGAATVAVYYYFLSFSTIPNGYFTEPYGPHKSTTYWRASDTGTSADTSNGYPSVGRNVEMYMAEVVQPPEFATPGLINFTYYPTRGATLPDLALAVNWETSRPPFGFYVFHSGPGTKTDLINHVKQDVYWDSMPVMVAVMTKATVNGTTYRLPNWTTSVAHAISIVGYDDVTSTFTYLDTCGRACNGSAGNHNGGTYSVSYTTLFKLLKAHGDGYVW